MRPNGDENVDARAGRSESDAAAGYRYLDRALPRPQRPLRRGGGALKYRGGDVGALDYGDRGTSPGEARGRAEGVGRDEPSGHTLDGEIGGPEGPLPRDVPRGHDDPGKRPHLRIDTALPFANLRS